MSAKSGQCLCGKVSFEAQDVKVHHHVCHCGMCRRWVGGPAFAASVGSVAWHGEGNIKRYASSDWAERGFCGECGSSLFFYFKAGDQYYINVGAFDDESDFTLVGEIYVDEQPPGYRFADGLPRITGDDFLAQFGGSDESGKS